MKSLQRAAGVAVLALLAGTASAQSLVISELRTAGPRGDTDEFVEVYNPGPTLTVAAADGSAGFALVASDGAVRFVIPNGTVIPAGGHYLGVNSAGFSLGAAPAATGTGAAGDASWVSDIPLNGGVALFKTANPASFDLDHRLDAVGASSELDPLYKEGAGVVDLAAGVQGELSFIRKLPGANAAAPGSCLTPASPQDSDDNASDFILVDTGGAIRRGSPGPQNLSSPIESQPVQGARAPLWLLDPAAGPNGGANWELAPPDAAPETAAGILTLRRSFRNESGAPLTRLRFRVVELSTTPAPPGLADLRALSAPAASVLLTGGGTAAVSESVVEQPPVPVAGAGVNATYSIPGISPASPLAPGATINVQFRFGVAAAGAFRFFVVPETSAVQGGQSWGIVGDSQGAALTDCGRAATTVTLTTPTPSVQLTQPVTFNAVVTGTPGAAGAPSGRISFVLGTSILGTAPVGPGGLVNLTVNTLGLGIQQIYAEYSGDGAFLASRSAVPAVVRVAAAPTVPVPPIGSTNPAPTVPDAGSPPSAPSTSPSSGDGGTPAAPTDGGGGGGNSDGGTETIPAQSVQVKDSQSGCSSAGELSTVPWLAFSLVVSGLFRHRARRD